MVTVGNHHIALRLEAGEVINHLRAEKHCSIIQRGLVDDDLRPLGLDALHDTLN